MAEELDEQRFAKPIIVYPMGQNHLSTVRSYGKSLIDHLMTDREWEVVL